MTQVQPPPGSQGLPFVGEAFQFLADPFGFQLERTRRHGLVWKTRILGDTTVFFAGPRGVSFFLDPDNFTRAQGSPAHMRELLHPDAVPFIDGERHRSRKRLLLQAFTPAALASYLPALERLFRRHVAAWATGDEVRLGAELNQLAFDLANVLFAAAEPDASDTATAADFQRMVRGMFAPPVKLPFTTYGKALRARDRLRAYIRDAVASRGGAGTALGVLKGARGPTGEALTTAELEIELLHFFSAAHAGVAAALAWLVVVLGQRPDVLAGVRAEVDALPPGGAGRDALAAMRYTGAVGREVRRVYPIAPSTFFGVARKDLEFDGHLIKQGWKACAALWPTLQDGATFAAPTEFQPERLDAAALARLPANAFVPQGGGPPEGHRCPGEVLTDLVLPLFAATLVGAHSVELPAQDLTPGAGGLGPLPRDGLRVRLRPRA